MPSALASVFGLLVPLWIVVILLGRRVDRGRVLRVVAAGAFVGLVGAICFIELRRYGLVDADGLHGGFRWTDALRFFLVGATAAWFVDVFDDRTATDGKRSGAQEKVEPTSRRSTRPAG